ncbi:unnamed protein product [Ectocarpus sp. 8 AP-2014]
MGEPLPPLPMPPPPRFAMLPAHLMEDVSDMIKFAAYTCPPDSRSGLTPLELISPIEASGILSFLVLFIGTSGYMRNPYIRAKMVEALVAFLPEVKKMRGYPTPSSMTSSLSAASRPSSWSTFGASALTGKASSATRRTAQSLLGSLTCSSTTASITWTRRSSSSLPSRPHRRERRTNPCRRRTGRRRGKRRNTRAEAPSTA